MLKGLSRLWWQGLTRMNKAQKRQNKKLVKSLLTPPPKRSRAKSGTAPAKKPKSLATPRTAVNSGISETRRTLPGKWFFSYFSSRPGAGNGAARRMGYWLYLPDRESTVGLPLVVMLHGCDQTASQFADGTRMNRLAEEKGFAVLYPQQSLRGHPQRCWPWYEKSVQRGGGEAELIIGVIDKVAQQYAIDMARIYVAGLSAGAAMAHILALAYPGRFAAVGLHSGPVFGAGHTKMGAYAVMQGGSEKASNNAIGEAFAASGAMPMPTIPAILVQGQADTVVRPINQIQLARQFIILNRLGPENSRPAVHKPASRGKKNPANPYRVHDFVVGRKPLLRVCEISYLEHAWSGGDCSVRYVACEGPDASKMLWDFFSRHTAQLPLSVVL